MYTRTVIRASREDKTSRSQLEGACVCVRNLLPDMIREPLHLLHRRSEKTEKSAPSTARRRRRCDAVNDLVHGVVPVGIIRIRSERSSEGLTRSAQEIKMSSGAEQNNTNRE